MGRRPDKGVGAQRAEGSDARARPMRRVWLYMVDGDNYDDLATLDQQGYDTWEANRNTRMNVDGKTVNLTPGMAATVEIKTGKRKLIEFLLSPLLRMTREAGEKGEVSVRVAS